MDGDGGAAGLHHRRVSGDKVADIDGLVEGHAFHRHGGDARSGPFGRHHAAGQVHLGQPPAAEDVAIGVGIGRHGDGAQGQHAGRRFRGVGEGHGTYQMLYGVRCIIAYSARRAAARFGGGGLESVE